MAKKIKLRVVEVAKEQGMTRQEVCDEYERITGETINRDKWYRIGRGVQSLTLYEMNSLAKALKLTTYEELRPKTNNDPKHNRSIITNKNK